MSDTAAHESKKVRRSCQGCRVRKARFRYRGKVRADRDHVLCFACFRSQRDRIRTHAGGRSTAALYAEGGTRRALTGREIGHRRRMLEHLHRTAESRTGGSL